LGNNFITNIPTVIRRIRKISEEGPNLSKGNKYREGVGETMVGDKLDLE